MKKLFAITFIFLLSWFALPQFRFPDAPISEQSNVSAKWHPSKWTKKISVRRYRVERFTNRGIGVNKLSSQYKR